MKQLMVAFGLFALLCWGVSDLTVISAPKPAVTASWQQMMDRGDQLLNEMNLKEAALAYQSAVDAAKKLGRSPSKTTNSLLNVAMVNRYLGNAGLAEQQYKAVLALKPLGLEEQVRAYHGLGKTYLDNNQPKQADLILNQALKLSENLKLPAEQASIVNDLGFLAKEQGDLALAEERYATAYRLIDNAENTENEDALAPILNNLGELYRIIGKGSEASTALTRAYQIETRTDGARLGLSTILNNMGEFYRNIGQGEKAISQHKRALFLDEKYLGPNHPFVARDCHNLALVLPTKTESPEIENLISRAIRIWTARYGQNYPDVGKAMVNRGQLAVMNNQVMEGEEWLQKGLAIQKQSLPNTHYEIAVSQNLLGSLLKRQKRYEEAKRLFTDNIRIYQKAYGTSSLQIGRTYSQLGDIAWMEKDVNGAIGYFQKEIALYEGSLGPKSRFLYQPLSALKQIAQALNKPTELSKIEAKLKTLEPLNPPAPKVDDAE